MLPIYWRAIGIMTNATSVKMNSIIAYARCSGQFPLIWKESSISGYAMTAINNQMEKSETGQAADRTK